MTKLPSLHSSEWAPDREPTLKTGAAALTVAALELLGKP
jgi:hippurate hydrolase